MKKSHTLKNLALKTTSLIVVFLFAFVFASNAQQTKTEPTTKATVSPSGAMVAKKSPDNSSVYAPRTIDNGYFSFTVTGDKKQDAANYRAARDNFKATNPAKYEKWEKEDKDGKKIITQEQFDGMPAKWQEHVKANPAKYEIRKN